MAQITRRRCGELLRKLFEILRNSPEGLSARVALEKLAGQVKLTDYEAGVYESSGARRFEKIVRFATVDCVKAGWLLKHKGLWAVTEAGLDAYKNWTDPEAFYKEAVRLYHVWKKGQTGIGKDAREAMPESDTDDVEKSSSILLRKPKNKPGARSKRMLRRWTLMRSRNLSPTF
jgi:restriction system protein